jgi:phosphoglycerate dehydrogenase-like enzyme
MAMPALYFDHPFPDLYVDLVDGRAHVIGPDESDLAQAQAIVAGARVQWNAALFSRATNARVISRIGIGYDNVDVNAALAAGLTVCNAPDAPTVSTAEHTMMLLLAVTKGLAAHQQRAAQGLPALPTSTTLELDGAIVGLVGLGRIARRVATACSALGMRVIAHDPFVGDEPAGVTMVSLDEVITRSDVVSLHAPLTEGTRHLVNADTLALMKRGVYLVNCARGGLVQHDALVDALRSGHVAGAGLDVTDPEPLPAGHPLLEINNVVVTPHVASSTASGRRRLYAHAIDNALAVLEGRPATVVACPG